VGDGERLVGLVSRLDPVKDHRTFLNAAADVARAREDVRFACVGDGDSQYRHAMQGLAHALGIGDRVLWIGARSDVTAVYSALDVSCSSSASEGFPNAVGEAMACGVPCVVTDVGDCAWLVGDPRLIVPRGDPRALAECIQLVLSLDPVERTRLCGELRDRVLAQFSVAHLADATERALLALRNDRR
jgi:glycosyltransferase involved in cell wall biosynthesis